MSKSKLREEYETRFGVVEGSLKLYDDNGNVTYYEDSRGYWGKRQYDTHSNQIYYEDSSGLWTKYEYDDNNNEIYAESSYGYWVKREYDTHSNEIYYENSKEGVVFDNRPCADKVFIDEQTGKKFKLTEVK